MMAGTVAITGAGCILPSGTGLDALRALRAPGSSGNARLVPAAVPSIEGIAKNDIRRMSRLTRYTIFAAHRALRAAGRPEEKAGLFVALTHGSTSLLAEFHDYLFDYGPDLASPNTFSNGVTNAPLSSVSTFLKVNDGGTTFLGYEEAGNDMLNDCVAGILDNNFSACCAGASEEFSEIVTGAYAQCGWYGTDLPPHLPFPQRKGDGKTGFGVAEGSAFLVLESLERAAKQGVPLCFYSPVDAGQIEGIDIDVVISGAGAGPQDSYELALLKRCGKRTEGKRPAIVFSRPLHGESFALGSMLSNCMAMDMVAHSTCYPSFPLHPDLQETFATGMTGPAQKVLVISCGRNGQCSAGLFLNAASKTSFPV
jgi:hypothetical protein